MNTTLSLHTSRLCLSAYRLDHIDALHALWTDPHVRRYLWDDLVIPRETAEEVVAGSLDDWSQRGYGQFVVSLRDDPAKNVIGFVGFRSGDHDSAPELLFGLLPAYWRQGLAFEASQRALAWIFTEREIASVWAATDPPNVASVRLLERLGFTFERRGTLNGLDTVFFRIAPQHPARPLPGG